MALEEDASWQGNAPDSPLWREIVDLHVFFVDWFTGVCPNDDAIFQARFTSRFDPHALYVMPGGTEFEIAAFAPGLKAAHGGNPDFAIHIRSVRSRGLGNGLVLALYEELQRGALASENSENARLTTAILRRNKATPNGFKWLHLQETWLPEERCAAADFTW